MNYAFFKYAETLNWPSICSYFSLEASKYSNVKSRAKKNGERKTFAISAAWNNGNDHKWFMTQSVRAI